MAQSDEEFLSLQRAGCLQRGSICVPADPGSKLGFAIRTEGRLPVNGLRHPPVGDTNGWYIWCGEELSSDPLFFVPMHTRHMQERCPDVLPLLGLPPGSRFLIAGDDVDLWFDESRISI